jgi:hypothetical protein
VDHSCFRRLTEARRRSVVAGVTSVFLVASAFVPALASPAHAAGSRPGSPKARSASPTARASLSTHDAIRGYGHWVVEKIKGGDIPEQHGFIPVSLVELKRKYHTEVEKGVFTLIASRVEDGEVKQAEFLAPRLEGSQIVYGNSYDEKLTEGDLKSRGYRNLFVRTFDRPAPTGETGAPEASPASDFAGHLPAGSVKEAITGIAASGGVKADVLRHLYSANNGERVFTPKGLAGELDGYNKDLAQDRSVLSNTLARLATVGLIKKIKEAGHDSRQSPASYQVLSANEVAAENIRSLQDRVNDVVGRGGATARVLEHLYRSGRTGEFGSRDVYVGFGEESIKTIGTALVDLADAGLIRKGLRPASGGTEGRYLLAEGVVLS